MFRKYFELERVSVSIITGLVGADMVTSRKGRTSGEMGLSRFKPNGKMMGSVDSYANSQWF